METRWDRENGTNLNAGENIFNTSDTATTSSFSGGSVGHFYINNNGIEVLSNGHAVHQQDPSALSCDVVEAHLLHGRANNIDCAMQEVCSEKAQDMELIFATYKIGPILNWNKLYP